MILPRKKKRRKRIQEPTALKELVDVVMPRDQPDEVRLMRIVAIWEQALPHRIVSNAVPVKIVREALMVHTSSSAWAQEVALMAPKLMELLRKSPIAKGRGLPFTKLSPKTGPLPPRVPVQKIVPYRVTPLPPQRLPFDVQEALRDIGDEGLHKAIQDAACTALAPRTAAKSETKKR